MKLGIYIGSFDPFHKGHKRVINHLLINKYVDKVLIVPTTNYWDKTNLLDLNKRIEMLKTYENENIKIDTKHNNITYTYELLEKLKIEYSDELYLILGADNIINFDKWKNYKQILNNKILILPRNNINVDNYTKKYKSAILVKDFKMIDISSTKIRNLIKNKNINELNKYLDEQIINYIIKNNLYQ